MDIRDILIFFAVKYEGNFEKISSAIKNKEHIKREDVEKCINELDCNVVTILDNNYPSCFKNIYKPPYVIFYHGDVSLLSRKKYLSVVGTRKPSNYGKSVTTDLLNSVLENEDVVIVSGLAIGIDSLAHSIALNNNRKTIAILANGLNEYYIKSNNELFNKIKDNGLIISEYPPFCKVDHEKFKVRNRLIAAFANALFIPEAKMKSGTAITVNYALENNKEILCVPTRIDETDSLCNFLIKEGAKVVLEYNDIIEEI